MKLLKETIESLDEQTSTVVSGHTGRGGSKEGMRVDDIWAGGYVATDEVIRDLKIQLQRRKSQRKEMENLMGKDNLGVDHPLGGYHDIETPALLATYDFLDAYSAAKLKYSKEATPDSELYYKEVNVDYHYEKINNDLRDKRKFLNKKDSMEFINKEKNYYNNIKKDLYDKEKLINHTDYMMDVETEIKYDEVIDNTEKNKKFVNDTNNWKSIYDNKKY